MKRHKKCFSIGTVTHQVKPMHNNKIGFVNEAYSRVIQETKRITFVQFLQRARYQKDKEYARAKY